MTTRKQAALENVLSPRKKPLQKGFDTPQAKAAETRKKNNEKAQ